MIPDYTQICIPVAPRAITKGLPVKEVLSSTAVSYLARNIQLACPGFDARGFYALAVRGLDTKSLMDRARHIAAALYACLGPNYQQALALLIDSLPPPTGDSEEFGLGALFFLPYSSFIAGYGVSAAYNGGRDPFDISMLAQRELTQRFSAEFSIRPFLINDLPRTLGVLRGWLTDPSNHIRRLCSEGVRPRLPWGVRLPALIKDPKPILPLLESLKNDPSLYVRRSVANNLGDIAKDHPALVFGLCKGWLPGADKNLRWVIRHALRFYARKGHPEALRLRERARDGE